VTLMAAIAFAFVVIAAVAPAALAGRSEVYFSDVNGNPKTEWKVGEVLYVTLISHDENRDSDEVELIDTRSVCRTHTGVDVPCLEIWDPNTKDSESNQGKIVLVETGIDTGIFRSQGIAVLPVEADPGYNENGSLEVFAGDTLMVRYQSPSDDNDIDLDQAKVSSTAGVVRITNQAGQEVPLWQVGQQVWVTVEDPDQNVDPLKPDVIKGVALWNPRCVWDVLERAGQPRLDQPEPKPCGAPVAFDDRLNQLDNTKFAPSLTLVETGPDTGVFRNVNGITLHDQLGPDRQFFDVTTALQMFVNHKDTIVAFYRLPTLVGAVAPPPPPPPPPVETRTDTCSASPLLECSRTVPVSVAPGQTFTVTVRIKAKQDLRLVAIREQAPSGFRFGQTQATPAPKNLSKNGALRAAWDGDIKDEDVITLTYELVAGPTPGTFKIRGFVTSAPFTILPLVSQINVTPAAAAGLGSAGVSAQAENAQLSITRQAPAQANVGQPFTVTLTVTAKQALPAVSVKENFDGFTLVDQGADFIGVEGTTLRGLMIQPAAGATQTFTYQLSCPSEGTFTISGTAESRNVPSVTETTTITCGAGGPPPPPPPAGPVTFHRGLAGPNDPQDFALAQAKVGHMNPAKLQFTDINGNEISEFTLGTEFFITLIDDDQNVDSDHVETLCVQVFNVNGGREGDTPGSQRSFSPLLKNEPGACMEDHVRDLFEWKTGVKLVETGTNTGVFRNPNALKVIPICDRPETDPFEESFTKDPNATQNIQIHKLNWWQNVEARTALKECYSGTPFLKEGRAEFTLNPRAAVEDVPGVIAVHAGDVVYVAFQDQLVDPFDVVYATARVTDYQTINQVQFVDENGAPVDTYKIGQDVFVKLRDENRNVSSDVVDKITILVLDRNSGDWENVILEETGPNTGEFMNRAGLSLQPATSPGAIKVNNNRLEMFDRDTIEAHYQDNFNPKDYSAAWIRLIPQPEPGPGVPVGPKPSSTTFSDAAGQPVSDYAVGDTVYVTVTDESQNVSASAADTIFGAITVTNTRTGEFVIVDATETGPDTSTFLSDPITTGAPGSGAMLEVEENDVLEAVYVDPSDPTDTSKATITVVTRVFSCTGAKNFPNPFTVTTTFEALGSGIAQITVTVYSLAGQQVAQLSVSGAQVTWDGRADTGESLGSGVYLYQVTCTGRAGESETSGVQKLVILK
jgi:hypothetical protein